jgi:hypothetical protein
MVRTGQAAAAFAVDGKPLLLVNTACSLYRNRFITQTNGLSTQNRY